MRETKAIFANDGLRAVAYPHLWQWDYHRVLAVRGLSLPEEYEAHICIVGDKKSICLTGTADGVEIPDEYLEVGKDIAVYIYLHNGEDDGTTTYTIRIPVKKRPRPDERRRFRNLFSEQVSVFDYVAYDEEAEYGPRAYPPYIHEVPLRSEPTSENAIWEMTDGIDWDGDAYTPYPHDGGHINRQGSVFEAWEPIDVLDYYSEAYDPEHRGTGISMSVTVVYDHCAQLEDMAWAGTAERGPDGE